MQIQALRASSVGIVVSISGFDARFGEALPGPVWMAVADAANELARLDAAASPIRNPQLVTRAATRREAIGTSALEGAYAHLTELFAAEVLHLDEQQPELAPNVREVVNYTRAADAAYAWIAERPISMNMLSALQAEIVRGTDSDGPEAGRIRVSQVFIGAKNRRINEARFIPPPPGTNCGHCVAWLTSAEATHAMHLVVSDLSAETDGKIKNRGRAKIRDDTQPPPRPHDHDPGGARIRADSRGQVR